jgi:hypothetical protein
VQTALIFSFEKVWMRRRMRHIFARERFTNIDDRTDAESAEVWAAREWDAMAIRKHLRKTVDAQTPADKLCARRAQKKSERKEKEEDVVALQPHKQIARTEQAESGEVVPAR